MKVRKLTAALWRSSAPVAGSMIMSGSCSEREASYRLRRRRKSSAALCAMRNSQPSGCTISPAAGSASIALTSASCTTSSPSITEPVMRAQ
jgi:hypothetical protein